MTRESLSFALIERDAKRIGRLHAQKYAGWIRDQFDRWKWAWRPECAIPVDETPQPVPRKDGAP